MRKTILSIAVLALTLFASNMYASSKHLIDLVRKGSFLDDDGVTIGELFSEKSIFESVKWTAGVDGDDEEVVQVRGETFFMPVDSYGSLLFFKKREDAGKWKDNVLKTTLTTRFRVSSRGGVSISEMEAKMLNETTQESIRYPFRHSAERNAVLDRIRTVFKENIKIAKLEAEKDPVKQVLMLTKDEKDRSNIDIIVAIYKNAKSKTPDVALKIIDSLNELRGNSKIATMSFDKIHIMDGKAFYRKNDINNSINSFQVILKNSTESASVEKVWDMYKKMAVANKGLYAYVKSDLENYLKENPNSIQAKAAYDRLCKMEEAYKAKIVKEEEEKRVQEHLAAERAKIAALRQKQEDERAKKAEEERLKKEKELAEKKKKEQEYVDKQKNGTGLDKAVKSLFNDLF